MFVPSLLLAWAGRDTTCRLDSACYLATFCDRNPIWQGLCSHNTPLGFEWQSQVHNFLDCEVALPDGQTSGASILREYGSKVLDPCLWQGKKLCYVLRVYLDSETISYCCSTVAASSKKKNMEVKWEQDNSNVCIVLVEG